jgi:hypothetical protein
MSRTREAEPGQDYNVLRTIRSAANCAMFDCFFGEVKTKYAYLPLFQLVGRQAF